MLRSWRAEAQNLHPIAVAPYFQIIGDLGDVRSPLLGGSVVKIMPANAGDASSLSCSVVFLYFFALIAEEGFLQPYNHQLYGSIHLLHLKT